MHDVIVVGGSYAGLAAALQLGRARRRVLVVDAGQRRNRFAARSHGLLGHDGRTPDEIIADARRQVLAYPTVAMVEGRAEAAEPIEGGFAVTDSRGGRHEGKRLILANGVEDELPDLPGLESLWGAGVFHCPYCHAYELAGRRLGVLASGPEAFDQAMLLSDWRPTVLFGNGIFEPDDEQRRALDRRGVTLEKAQATGVRADGDGVALRLADGREEGLAGLFVHPVARDPSPLARLLGCAFDDGPHGRFIRTDEEKATTVPGVFACGDAARMAGNLPVAAADGALAGFAAHQSLVFEE